MQQILKIIGLLLLFQNILFANYTNDIESNQTERIQAKIEKKQEIVCMDSIGEAGIVLLIVLTSTLGSFFLRDQFSDLSQV